MQIKLLLLYAILSIGKLCLNFRVITAIFFVSKNKINVVEILKKKSFSLPIHYKVTDDVLLAKIMQHGLL